MSELGATDAVEPLTPREREVVELVADGRTYQAIANRLRVSVRAVEKHVESAQRKLGARNRAALVREALRRELIS
jgi:DNA-binding CsgD family transcriptional regulator